MVSPPPSQPTAMRVHVSPRPAYSRHSQQQHLKHRSGRLRAPHSPRRVHECLCASGGLAAPPQGGPRPLQLAGEPAQLAPACLAAIAPPLPGPAPPADNARHRRQQQERLAGAGAARAVQSKTNEKRTDDGQVAAVVDALSGVRPLRARTRAWSGAWPHSAVDGRVPLAGTGSHDGAIDAIIA